LPRILEKEQITALDSRAVPPLFLPQPGHVFRARAARLDALAEHDALGGYLHFAASLARAQAVAIDANPRPGVDSAALDVALVHGMPPLPARGLRRGAEWREVLRRIAGSLAASEGFPSAVAQVGERLGRASDADLESRAERLLAADGHDVDPAAAPVIMAALQVFWVGLAAGLDAARITLPAHAAVCPTCGLPPVASVVKGSAPLEGYRYLHCGLCATEWHRVRVECTGCGGSRGVAYQSVEGGPAAIRAETCDECHGYRKIFYQEHEAAVEPLADDLASVALDLLLAEAGYHRLSANPLLWQPEP
jgi:FdhE protein